MRMLCVQEDAAGPSDPQATTGSGKGGSAKAKQITARPTAPPRLVELVQVNTKRSEYIAVSGLGLAWAGHDALPASCPTFSSLLGFCVTWGGEGGVPLFFSRAASRVPSSGPPLTPSPFLFLCFVPLCARPNVNSVAAALCCA